MVIHFYDHPDYGNTIKIRFLFGLHLRQIIKCLYKEEFRHIWTRLLPISIHGKNG